MRPLYRFLPPLLPALGLVLASSRGDGQKLLAADAQPPAPQPRSVSTAPLTYFQDNCARCHGDEGAFYDKAALAKRADAQLRQSIRDMADGPGDAPLSGEGVAVQMALHRAIAKGAPFLAVTKWQAPVLQGEATAGSRVWLELGSAKMNAEISGSQWKIALPSKVDWAKSSLHAALGGQDVSLLPVVSGYSGAVE